MKDKKVLFLVQGAAIAAIYVVLTVVFAPFGFGEIQLRVSEALTILPYFTPAAIPGLFVGCIIGNTLGGAITVPGTCSSCSSKRSDCSVCTTLRLWSTPSDSIYDADCGNRRSIILRCYGYGPVVCP